MIDDDAIYDEWRDRMDEKREQARKARAELAAKLALETYRILYPEAGDKNHEAIITDEISDWILEGDWTAIKEATAESLAEEWREWTGETE